MATHKTRVLKDDNQPSRSAVAKAALPWFKLPPKISRVIAQNDQPYVRSDTAVDGAGRTAADNKPHGNEVVVTELPTTRDPILKATISINLANAVPAGGLTINVAGNAILYADSTNGTDRLNLQYGGSQGDASQPLRIMVPGRLRREARFYNIVVTWTVTAGATATLEIYDDPDKNLDIVG